MFNWRVFFQNSFNPLVWLCLEWVHVLAYKLCHLSKIHSPPPTSPNTHPSHPQHTNAPSSDLHTNLINTPTDPPTHPYHHHHPALTHTHTMAIPGKHAVCLFVRFLMSVQFTLFMNEFRKTNKFFKVSILFYHSWHRLRKIFNMGEAQAFASKASRPECLCEMFMEVQGLA